MTDQNQFAPAPPFEALKVETVLYWHEAKHQDKPNIWLREQIKETLLRSN